MSPVPAERADDRPKLLMSRADASEKLEKQVAEGRRMKAMPMESEKDCQNALEEATAWNDYNVELLRHMFATDGIAREYTTHTGKAPLHDAAFEGPDALAEFLSSAIAKLVAVKGRLELIQESPQAETQTTTARVTGTVGNGAEVDPRKVFVVYGRNTHAKQAMFDFLRALGLHPIDWSEAVELTGIASPYVGQVLDAAFRHAQAVVVMMTGDDSACLLPEYQKPDDPPHEKQPTPQARPNVLFEAGLAFGTHPTRTILVEMGKLQNSRHGPAA